MWRRLCRGLELRVAPLIKGLHGRPPGCPDPPAAPRRVPRPTGPPAGVEEGVGPQRPVAGRGGRGEGQSGRRRRHLRVGITGTGSRPQRRRSHVGVQGHIRGHGDLLDPAAIPPQGGVGGLEGGRFGDDGVARDLRRRHLVRPRLVLPGKAQRVNSAALTVQALCSVSQLNAVQHLSCQAKHSASTVRH